MTQNYPVFIHWYKTLNWILSKVDTFPRNIKFTLGDRIVTLAFEILERIIEAIYKKERIFILDEINLCLEKQRILFRISHDRKYLSHRQYEYIIKEINTTGQMIGGWRKQNT